MSFNIDLIRIATYLGAGIGVGVASIACGIGEGYIAGKTETAMMRQPEARDHLYRNMFIGQAITETSGIFALVIGLLLLFGGFDVAEGGWFRVASLFSAGIAIGFGAIGPSFGSGYSGGLACSAIARQPKYSNTIIGNMLIGQALAQSSNIFALLVSLLLLYSTPLQGDFPNLSTGMIILKSVAFLSAGLAIGLGTLGPGSGIGNVAAKANDMIGRYPRNRFKTIRAMFLGAAVTQSTAIYSLVISFLLIFAV